MGGHRGLDGDARAALEAERPALGFAGIAVGRGPSSHNDQTGLSQAIPDDPALLLSGLDPAAVDTSGRGFHWRSSILPGLTYLQRCAVAEP